MIATLTSLNVESPGRTDLNKLFWVLSSVQQLLHNQWNAQMVAKIYEHMYVYLTIIAIQA